MSKVSKEHNMNKRKNEIPDEAMIAKVVQMLVLYPVLKSSLYFFIVYCR